MAEAATALLSASKKERRASLSDVLGGAVTQQMMTADDVNREDVERLMRQTKRHRNKHP